MKNRILLLLGILAIVAGVVFFSAAFTVQESEQALVLQFGNPKRTIDKPGLHFKLPFVQNAVTYEKRVINLDPPTQRVLLADQKPLLVDAFARYRIIDPLRFYQRVRTITTANNRLDAIVNAALRGELGRVNLSSVLSEERAGIMTRIRDQVNVEARGLGIDIVDVRIRRSDLPEETSQAVYERMKSERQREAQEFRAQGKEQAQRIRASAEREATVILAEATREGEILRGQGEGERTRLLADAFGTDPEFFEFYRSLQAYEAAIGEGGSTLLVLSPDDEFFQYFNKSSRQGQKAGQD